MKNSVLYGQPLSKSPWTSGQKTVAVVALLVIVAVAAAVGTIGGLSKASVPTRREPNNDNQSVCVNAATNWPQCNNNTSPSTGGGTQTCVNHWQVQYCLITAQVNGQNAYSSVTGQMEYFSGIPTSYVLTNAGCSGSFDGSISGNAYDLGSCLAVSTGWKLSYELRDQATLEVISGFYCSSPPNMSVDFSVSSIVSLNC